MQFHMQVLNPPSTYTIGHPGRGITTLFCHALSLPFTADTLIQRSSDVISLQLETYQAQGAFNCPVGAALLETLPRPDPHLLLFVLIKGFPFREEGFLLRVFQNKCVDDGVS